MGIRVEVTQSEHEILRIEKDCGRGATQQSQQSAETDYWTMCEAAEVSRLSARTVREYVRRGEIRGKITGKRWTLRRADLDAEWFKAPVC